METHGTLADLCDEVLRAWPTGSKVEWGVALDKLIDAKRTREFRAWRYEKTVIALGNTVSARRSHLEKQERATLDYYGRPLSAGRQMTPTLSVRTDKGRQQMLWVECSPQQFMEAVAREQAVVDGRQESNALRLQVVKLLKARPQLQELPTLGDVCLAIGVDPEALNLDELPQADDA